MEFEINKIKTRCKPICVYRDNLIVYSKGFLSLYTHSDRKISKICKLPMGNLKQSINKILRLFTHTVDIVNSLELSPIQEPEIGKILPSILKIRICERILGGLPKQGVIDSNERLWLVHRGDLLCINLDTNRIILRYSLGNGGPLTKLTVIKDVLGFENGLVFGEYFGNLNRGPVSIYFKSDRFDEWKKVYQFKDKIIRHIHNIVSDSERNCVYILTGDENNEPGIWVAKNNFTDVKPLLVGSQKYRSCVLFIGKDNLIYATDTPLEDNYITFVKDINDKPNMVKIASLPGSCIYGDAVGGRYLFATTVEPDSNILYSKGRFKYKLSYKLGAGIKDWYSHLFICSENGDAIEICKFKKDILPPALFGFGYIEVVADENNNCAYIYPVNVKRVGGCLIKINLS